MKLSFENEILAEIATTHEKTVAQIILRWNIQRGVVVIIHCSSNRYDSAIRMLQNILIYKNQPA